MLHLWLFCLCLARGAFALTGQQIASHFRSTLSSGSGVYLPSEANYTLDTAERWNAFNAPSYVVSVKPALIQDVQKVVKYATKNNISFLATGGGHGYTETLRGVHNGVQLNLGNFRNISINSDCNTMTIGGSLRFRDVTGHLQRAGKEMTIGTCSCVGVAGATLGGGVGIYSGLHGATSDSLLSVEMVSGNGEILHVSPSENSDLFWGMKGAGANFGVVTSLTYRVHNATNNGMAMNADMIFPAEANHSVWSITKEFSQNNKQPAELTMTFGVGFNANTSQMDIIGNFIYAGPLAKGKELIKPYLDLKPKNVNISSIPWSALEDESIYGATAKGCKPGGKYLSNSLNLYQVDVDNLVDTMAFMREKQAASVALQPTILALSLYPRQGFQQYPQNSSSYPWRNVTVFAEIDAFFTNASDASEVGSWASDVRSSLLKGSGVDELEVYTNFAHGDEGPASWYSADNLPRLRALKRRYDPHGLFNFFNPVGKRT